MAVMLAFSIACAGAEPTATPVPPASPAPPQAPTPAAAPIPAVAPATPTPVLAVPTPTRLLPTPTPVVVGKPLYGGTIRYATEWPFTAEGLDPAFTVQSESRRALHLIFSNVVAIASDASLAPDLARSWDFSPDGKTITFRLREGVKFHDGTPMDANVIKWNYDRFLDPAVGAPRSASLDELDKVEVVDSLTVRFRLKQAYRPLLGEMTSQEGGHVASPTAVQKTNSYAARTGEYGKKPAGTGPYKLSEWVPGSHLIFVRNEEYWEKGKPYADRILFQVATDRAVRVAMIRTGETDIIERLTAADAKILRGESKVKVVQVDGVRYTGLKFRVTVAPWNNRALRQAIAYAVDRRGLIEVAEGGFGIPAYGPIGPAYGVWYDPTFKTFDLDIQKAKEKLIEAGFPSGMTATIHCDSSTSAILVCEAYQAMLAKVGIILKIGLVPAGTSFAELRAGKIDATTSGISTRADPHVNLYRWYHSKGSSTVGFKIGYNNPEYDRLIDEASGTYDVPKAKQLYIRAQKILAEDATDVFSVHQSLFYGMRDAVQSFAHRIDNVPRLGELWLSR